MDEKTRLLTNYNNNQKSKLRPRSPEEQEAQREFHNQLKSLQEDYDAAEAHYKLIKDHLEAQEAICKERQRIVKQRAASSPSDVDMQDSGSLDIAPDYEIKKHAALIRVFNYKRVPVLDITTKEIDFSRVELEKKANAPTLKFQLDNVPEKEIALKVARTVIDFLKAFETYYHNFLTDDLFEDLAWRYMGFALEQIRLDNKYNRLIKTEAYGDRSWKQVKRSIHLILKLDLIRSWITCQITDLTVLPHEDANTFADRIESIVEAGGLQPMGVLLYGKVITALSDAGQERVFGEFKSLDAIKDIDQLLDFIRANPSVLTGEKNNPCAWFINNFTTKGLQTNKAPSSMTGISPPTRPQRSTSRPTSRNRDTRKDRRHPYQQGQRARKDESAVILCKDPVCISLKRRHADADCFRHTKPTKFAELNKQAQAKERARRDPKSNYKVAAITQIKEDSYNDVIGNDLEFAIKRMDISPYVDSPTGSSLDAPKYSSLIHKTVSINHPLKIAAT
ncbi:hypothetical protein BX616_007253, partial [Lobosporangium transversale]